MIKRTIAASATFVILWVACTLYIMRMYDDKLEAQTVAAPQTRSLFATIDTDTKDTITLPDAPFGSNATSTSTTGSSWDVESMSPPLSAAYLGVVVFGTGIMAAVLVWSIKTYCLRLEQHNAYHYTPVASPVTPARQSTRNLYQSE
eukprot:TRINITY_DN3679_c0_g1_i1.p1 TRINITY_DN3679_c0_g1~~TRINITY_DN3679_c0_g1_i1.p1  ORF type:complete len:146 (+),score=26.88 TRINITY_DN3679_c0_g1_i1:44-481(+)